MTEGKILKFLQDFYYYNRNVNLYSISKHRCPLDDSILSPFRRGMKKLTFFADFTMFRFNGSHEFNIQCSIIKCRNRCVDRNCVRHVQTTDNLLYDAADQTSQDFKSVSTLATTRLIVRDHIKTNGNPLQKVEEVQTQKSFCFRS